MATSATLAPGALASASHGRLAQLVRAPRLHRGGRGFEALTAHCQDARHGERRVDGRARADSRPGAVERPSRRDGQLVQEIAQRVAADGVTLNTLLPGSFATARIFSGADSREAIEEQKRQTIPAARLGDPAEFAAAAAFLCSTRASYLTGETIAVDGGKTCSVF